jgi:2-polyprenyl-6-methoxyphenol hydroxylase-like FAD-dependent oxidoreductase
MPSKSPPSTSSSSSSWPLGLSWSQQSDSPPLRIAVVGAGIAGLTFAQIVFPSPNVEVMVYEKSSDAVDRLSGYRIMVSTPVLMELKARLPREIWDRIEASIGVQPENGQELAFMKRYSIESLKLMDTRVYELIATDRK